ncbi:MAG: hypothetical protein U0165_14855 [Polyangiaceae bacterium]
MNRSFAVITAVLGSVVFLGCGGSDDSSGTTSTYPYTPGTADVHTPDGTTTVGSDSSGCITTSNGTCIKLPEKCGKDRNAAEIYTDKDGNVLAIVCYPTDGVTVDPVAEPPVDDLKDGNNSVIVLDGADDGPDVTGDVTLDGNNLTLYGQGPDVSEIGGNLTITQNNAVVHGLTVDGNVTFEQNGGTISDCVVKGDVYLKHNNSVVAGCDVWGKIVVTGNNNIVVSNRIQGGFDISGKMGTCENNLSFSDANNDKVIQDSEVGAEISCN